MKKLLLILLLPAVLSGTARAGELSPKLAASLDSMIADGLRNRAFPGASLVVGDRDGILYARDYGFHDYSGKSPVTDRDVFDVASCTKVLSTTFVLMHLYDEGKIRLLDPLSKYLPRFAGTPAGEVTLRELLTHTSGMRPQVFYTPLVGNAAGGSLFSGKKSEDYPYEVGKNYYVARKVALDSSYLSHTPQNGWREAATGLYVNPAVDTLIFRQIVDAYKPDRRSTYSYSDTNFLLLKLIAEKVAGQPLDTLTHRLFDELGCTDTYYNPLQYREKGSCMPTETDYILGRGTVQGSVHDELGALMGGVGGNAGLFTTAGDMACFCEMMLNGGHYRGKEVISGKTVSLFTSSPYEQNKIWRGLGFDKRDPQSDPLGARHSFGHTGFTGTIFWIDADKGLYMVFLSNAVHPTRVNNKLSASQLRTKIWQALSAAPELKRDPACP